MTHPALAREFGDAVAEEDLNSADAVDTEIAEVWRTATAPELQATSVMTHGALLEALQASIFIDDYRTLAAQEMELDTDVETARQVLDEAFHKLRLRRLEVERQQRLVDYDREPSAQRLDAYRAADLAYLAARCQVSRDARSSS